MTVTAAPPCDPAGLRGMLWGEGLLGTWRAGSCASWLVLSTTAFRTAPCCARRAGLAQHVQLLTGMEGR